MKYENRIPGLLEVYNVQLGQRGNAVLNNVTGKYESPQEGPTRTGSIALEIAKKCSEQFISAFEDGIPAKLVKDLVTSMREAGDHDTRNQLLHSESNISIIPIITNESDVSEGYEHPSLNAEQIPELLRMSKKITSLMNGNNDEEIEFSEPLPTAEQMDAILAGLIKHLDFFSKKYPARTEEKAKASQQLVKKWAQNIAAIASADSTASIQAEQRAESAKYNLALFSLATLIDGSQVYGGIQSES